VIHSHLGPEEEIMTPRYSSAMYALELDQKLAGRPGTVDLGIVGEGEFRTRAELERALSQPDSRHVSRPAKLAPGLVHAETSFYCGTGMSSAFYEWLKDSMAGPRKPKSLALIGLTFDRRIIHRLEFDCAVISEISFPALDAASKDSAYLTVKLAPGGGAISRLQYLEGQTGPLSHARLFHETRETVDVAQLPPEHHRPGVGMPVCLSHRTFILQGQMRRDSHWRTQSSS
jgi:hypothetical protein